MYSCFALGHSNCGDGTLLTAHPKVATLAGGLAACLSVCIIAFFGFHLYLAMSNMVRLVVFEVSAGKAFSSRNLPDYNRVHR